MTTDEMNAAIKAQVTSLRLMNITEEEIKIRTERFILCLTEQDKKENQETAQYSNEELAAVRYAIEENICLLCDGNHSIGKVQEVEYHLSNDGEETCVLGTISSPFCFTCALRMIKDNDDLQPNPRLSKFGGEKDNFFTYIHGDHTLMWHQDESCNTHLNVDRWEYWFNRLVEAKDN